MMKMMSHLFAVRVLKAGERLGDNFRSAVEPKSGEPKVGNSQKIPGRFNEECAGIL
jgi:hypothetical protein